MTDAIRTGSRVSMRHSVSVDGSIREDSRDSKPFRFIQGGGILLRGLSSRLEGLRVGDERTFELPPEEAHGSFDSSAIQIIAKDSFPLSIEPKVGVTFKMKNKAGEVISSKILEVNKDNVTLDNNHPMAGKTLIVTVKILTIE